MSSHPSASTTGVGGKRLDFAPVYNKFTIHFILTVMVHNASASAVMSHLDPGMIQVPRIEL